MAVSRSGPPRASAVREDGTEGQEVQDAQSSSESSSERRRFCEGLQGESSSEIWTPHAAAVRQEIRAARESTTVCHENVYESRFIRIEAGTEIVEFVIIVVGVVFFLKNSPAVGMTKSSRLPMAGEFLPQHWLPPAHRKKLRPPIRCRPQAPPSQSSASTRW